MKKITAISVALFVLFNLTACSFGIDNTQKIPEEVTYDFLDTYITSEYISKYEDGHELFEGSQEYVVLSDESAKKYPNLAKAIKAYNAETLNYFQQGADESITYARETIAEGYPFYGPYTDNEAFYVCRADSKILSILIEADAYMGGAHGNYAYAGENFDPETGNKLELSDVCLDINAFALAVKDELVKKYPGAYFHDLDGSIESCVTEYGFVWTMDNQGVTVYFSPYELASFADGEFEVKLLFENYSHLFDTKYQEVPAGYMAPITEWGTWYDVDGDGDTEEVYVSGDSWNDEYYDFEALELSVGEKRFTICEDYFFGYTAYFAHIEKDGIKKNLLLVETVAENGYGTIYIYEMSGYYVNLLHKEEGVNFHSNYEKYNGAMALLNPFDIIGDTRVDPLSTMFGSKHYEIDITNGSLIAKTEHYKLETNNTLTSKVPLKVKNLNSDKEITVPAGTTFSFVQTDDLTFVDFSLSDDTLCRLMVDLSKWPRTINGIDEYDCFDNIMYAG